MKNLRPVADYRKLRLNNLCSDEFRHLLLLLYWPVYGLLFGYVERGYEAVMPILGLDYYPMYCRLDDLIPFNEWFLIPYLLWFAYIIGMLLYTLLYDIDGFRRMMYFTIFTYTVSLIFYFVFPTVQNLRPTTFENTNLLTRFIEHFYRFDTNTNVCPSVHVFGSFASTFALSHARGLQKPVRKLTAHLLNVSICLSTVFLKQHSVLDIFVALPFCLVGYLMFYVFPGSRKASRAVTMQRSSTDGRTDLQI